mgnify:CR=1 FL=1
MKRDIPLKRIEAKILKRIGSQYQKKGKEPWVIAYSGGKDSTLVLHLVVQYLMSIKRHKRTIHVVCNDTLVESPFVMDIAKEYISKFDKYAKQNNLPMSFHITAPEYYDTFWTNIIGKGYPPPSRMFRWCTDRLKIRPTTKYITEVISKNGSVIMLIGSRMQESKQREKSIKKHLTNQEEFLSNHSTLENCEIFMPIADINVDDLWEMISAFRTFWGERYTKLIQLYKDALNGECPIILAKDDIPSCGNKSARFGCWTCTVVKKDKSLEGLSRDDSNNFELLVNFRNWLIDFTSTKENRYPFSRKGVVRKRDDNTIIPGPLTLEARQKIYDNLMELGYKTNHDFLSEKERFVIKQEWHEAKVLQEMTKNSIEYLNEQMTVVIK